MHVTVNSQYLAQELRLLNKVAPVKTPLPILSCVLLTATDTLQLYATNLEIGLRAPCPATVLMPGQVALPAAKLLALVEQFPNADVTIMSDKKDAHLSCGAFTSVLQLQDTIDFPVAPEPPGQTSRLHAANFMQMIKRTRYAISDKANQFLLRGALLACTDTHAAMATIDGKRLALATMPYEGAPLRVTIPMETLDVLLAQPEIAETSVTRSENHLFFNIGTRRLNSRLIDGEFPHFERIIPTNCTKKAVVSRLDLAAALNRVGLVSGDDQSIRLSFSDGAVEITASSAKVGTAGERVVLDYQGEPLTVYCNWEFIVDFLNVAVAPKVTIEMKDDKTPLLLTEGDMHLAVIMLLADHAAAASARAATVQAG